MTSSTTAPDASAQTHSSRLSPSVLIAIVVTILAWTSAFVVIRAVGPHFSGGSLALGRLLVGSILLSALVIGRRWVKPTLREWLLILVFGVAWFGAYNVALNIAEQTLDAGTSAMIVNVAPLLIALGAGVFLGEGIPRWLAIGAGVAFIGVVLIGFGAGFAGFGDGSGILWALLAAVTYSIGVLCQKPALKRIPARQVTWMGCVIGMLVCLPFAGSLINDLHTAPAASIVGMIYLGAVPTALAFSTWAYALSRMPAGQLGITTYVVPALTVIAGLLFFGEIPAPLAIAGGIVCLAGVAVSRMRIRSRRQRDEFPAQKKI